MANVYETKVLCLLCLTFTLVGLVNIFVVFQVSVDKRLICQKETKTQGEIPHQDNTLNVSFPLEFKPLELERKKEEIKLDEWKTTGAMNFLKAYNKELNNNVQPIAADPNNISTITAWWQAAAMIHWYFNSTLRFKCPQELNKYANFYICQETIHLVRESCVAYSFGVKNDFSFDDSASWIRCNTWSFDPGMNLTDHLRGDRIHFYNMGLGTTNTDVYRRPNEQVKHWKMRTFKAIQQMIGHKQQPLDIVKLNIGGDEWGVLDYLKEHDLLKTIRYLMVHFHLLPSWPDRENYVNIFRTLTRLRQLGFREYHSNVSSVVLDAKNYLLRARVLYFNANFKWFF